MTLRLRMLTSVILIAIIAILLSSCSTFKSTKRVDLTPFAQLDAEGPEKADALAGYLEYLKEPSIDAEKIDVHITSEEFDEILADIRTRESLIDGINAAQPVADEIARITGEHISRVEVLQIKIEDAITAAIDDEHGTQISFLATIKKQHARALESLGHLLDYADGDQGAIAVLREHDPRLMREIPERRDPNELEVTALVDRLLERLDRIEKVRESLRADLDAYEMELGELHRLLIGHRDAVRKARALALAWAQAHRKLASGIVDPAAIDMFGITKSLIKGAL